jgi:hypothetical protein
VLREGWPKYHVGLIEGAAVIKYHSTNPDSIRQEARRLREMGLEEGVHFTVKMPEEGRYGYVYIRRKGLEHAVWLSVYGSGRQRGLAAEFVEYILRRAWEAGEEVYEKAKKIVDEGKARGSLRLEGFEKEVKVDGEKHKVKVLSGGAEFEKSESGKLLLRIKIAAEMDGVRSEYAITYSRLGRDKAAVGRAYASANAPGGREADAKRLAAVIKALTGREPKVYQRSDGTIEMVCGREHLESFKRYAELTDATEKLLEDDM